MLLSGIFLGRTLAPCKQKFFNLYFFNLLYISTFSTTYNASRLKFDIPVKTERSRLISMLLSGIFLGRTLAPCQQKFFNLYFFNLLYISTFSTTYNASRLKFDIPVKTERSRLISMLLSGIFLGRTLAPCQQKFFNLYFFNLLYISTFSTTYNASRLKFDIPVKTERSRLISMLLSGIFLGRTLAPCKRKFFLAPPVMCARNSSRPCMGITGSSDRFRSNQNIRTIFAM